MVASRSRRRSLPRMLRRTLTNPSGGRQAESGRTPPPSLLVIGLLHHGLPHGRLPVRAFRILRSHHQFPDRNVGVTMTVWDWEFGTHDLSRRASAARAGSLIRFAGGDWPWISDYSPGGPVAGVCRRRRPSGNNSTRCARQRNWATTTSGWGRNTFPTI